MTTDESALRRPYRVVRTMRAHDDGPWPGVLVRTAGGASHVFVDAASLPSDWMGWAAPADGHVLAPVDIARRTEGHDVVLAVCLERLEEFVRRREARMPLSSGEAVTLAVSVLRGSGQVAAQPEIAGEWWLDDAGKPVLATDVSTRPALDAAAAILESVTVEPALQRTWDTAVRAISADRLSIHELTAAEDALFAIATAEPLSTVSLSPRKAAEGLHGLAERAEDRGPAHAPAPRSMWQSLISGVDEELADTVSRATTAAWRRLRTRERPGEASSRRAPWLLGGAVAVAVLAGGALWPTAGGVATDGAGPAGDAVESARTPAPQTSATGAGAQAAAVDSGEGSTETDAAPDPGPPPENAAADLAVVAARLVDARLACGADSECLGDVLVDPAAIAAGAVDLPSGERTITLLDDFGDLAVLRLDPVGPSQAPQLVVILRQNEKWLLRDVRDVAQQP